MFGIARSAVYRLLDQAPTGTTQTELRRCRPAVV
jgi:hypothetical protein